MSDNIKNLINVIKTYVKTVVKEEIELVSKKLIKECAVVILNEIKDSSVNNMNENFSVRKKNIQPLKNKYLELVDSDDDPYKSKDYLHKSSNPLQSIIQEASMNSDNLDLESGEPVSKISVNDIVKKDVINRWKNLI